jgi:hypothetical protein
MAEVQEAYSTHLYNSIPDLHDARDSFTAKGGADSVNSVFKPLILKHQLEAVLGVGLLHRHFDLRDNEKLVEFNNISIPWRHQQGDDHTGGKLLPSAWLIKEGRLIPYEFYFSPLGLDNGVDLTKFALFLCEFIESVKALELDKTMALRVFPQVNFTGALEITEGRANINLTPDQVRYQS